MTILNEKTNETKTRELKHISCIYTTQGKTDTENVGDYILLGNVNYNTLLKSLRLTAEEVISGFTADVVILNNEKKEFTYRKADDSEGTLTALKTGVSFAAALNNVEELDFKMKFQTLEQYIINETADKAYRGQVFIALKVKTAPTTKKEGQRILAEVDFVENI